MSDQPVNAVVIFDAYKGELSEPVKVRVPHGPHEVILTLVTIHGSSSAVFESPFIHWHEDVVPVGIGGATPSEDGLELHFRDDNTNPGPYDVHHTFHLHASYEGNPVVLGPPDPAIINEPPGTGSESE